jgi:maltose/moltooligosaccharide transporter
VRLNFVLIALTILGTNIGMALFRSPTVAYLGDLFPAEQRSRANGVINLMGGVGGALALLGGGTLYKIGVPLPFIVGSVILLVAIGVVIWKVKEPAVEWEERVGKEPGLLENIKTVVQNADRSGLYLLSAIFAWFMAWNAIETFFTLYARNVLHIEPGNAARMLTLFAAMLIVFAIPSGLIATRIGRRPTILIGLVGMLAGLAVCSTLRDPQIFMVVLLLMGGFWALVNINSLPMVYDLGEQRSIGSYTGLYYFSSSSAAIAGPILAGGLVQLLGNDYTVIWLYGAVFMALALFLMSRVRGRAALRKPAMP